DHLCRVPPSYDAVKTYRTTRTRWDRVGHFPLFRLLVRCTSRPGTVCIHRGREWHFRPEKSCNRSQMSTVNCCSRTQKVGLFSIIVLFGSLSFPGCSGFVGGPNSTPKNSGATLPPSIT